MSAPDDLDEAVRLMMHARELTDFFHSIMEPGEATGMLANAAVISFAIVDSGVTGLYDRSEAISANALALALRLEKDANGRKLTNTAKRKRLEATAKIYREAARRIDLVLTADGKAKANG